MILTGGFYEDVHLVGDYVIPDYNPEWVSIDVRFYDPLGAPPLYISGTICHECVPEPASLLIWSFFGVVGLLASG